ncbi:hypothetical protein HNP37_001045 [Flavobacterium nitrogenifigens]|uniref:NlpE N-terminal domain-containing protein n=2 Tax=Flavobacterium TaxID=237 RepID=A0A7W7IUV7_9FLAO|nr:MULTISPECIES: hypothetical protein [Flavobacterium]MBB4801006.1 hypothetical protein [Flavobacterium nitrogenifigens]MBB6385246.1 hypothetical protein [Flavobacterium notoginsengisoli]
MNKILSLLFLTYLILTACNQKAESNPAAGDPKIENTVKEQLSKDEIEGTYKADGCDLSVIISKIKNDYQYTFKTSIRTLKGKATYSKNNSGEKYVTLEGIKWDEYEGDLSNESDSVSQKELEIPVGIDALYTKDTLTIQNYGNSMNSYTKISECGLKYIQLIKK